MLKTLESLPVELGSRGGGPTRYALFQAAKMWRDHAASIAPSGPGPGPKLRDNMRAKRDPRPDLTKYSERYAVTFSGKTYWGVFVERGTRKQSPQSFLRRTMDEKGDEAITVFADAFRRRLDQAVRKARQG